ncbi:ankyrin repeat and MYND domain-containing protein 2-like isoform X2 [Varroa jacobsoni]|nr:ankyrin repeat and MYND domain-containing protein 2-like isoform X2 [Varroa destructor]XP_022664223.1 ankyrin repeat and MYND domain-containing protein 2-like isoform X2 [Varroa destructor]XP_022687471.1 ankyrin repeat and MYND domain-containing protein 2-like isoform X2 [Varroa jacobsoni]XP_022687472.1 ankyrin repeat and MYND domain-containing protein 2-like isoform X2 [Varroa jacobsoni]XP_022687473.1 ankyrin repeat and MYND domain-containing protein 2-like isoform X2 [Varroa jacobsoni]
MSLIKLCQSKDVDLGKIRGILMKGKEDSGLDELDDQGMTPLQHAAFKGNADLVKMLIDHGACVNTYEHNEGYSTLMFGALSGNVKVVQQLLDAGAKTHTVNKVNRTASEMAAFLGMKHIVATIKGYVPMSDIVYYTKKQELESEPRLPSEWAEPLRMLIMQANVHPVRVAYTLEEHPELVDKKVCSVLQTMSERYFKRDGNEWLSGKIHFVKCIIEHVLKNGVEESLKSWLKGRQQDGFKLNLDNFIRQCVRSYAFHESGEFRQMVTTLAHTPQAPPIDDDGAITVFLGMRPDGGCQTCWELNAQNRCAACKATVYCDRRCQKIDWSSHKKLCESMSLAHEDAQAPCLKN